METRFSPESASGKAAVGVAILCGGFLVVATLTRPGLWTVLIATVAVAIGIRIDVQRGVGIFSPLVPLFLAVLTSLTLPALSGYYDLPGAFAVTESANSLAALYFSLFIVIAVVSYNVCQGSETTREVVPAVTMSPSRALAGWLLAVGIALVGLALLAQAAGGIEPYLLGLSNRTVALAGQGRLLWLLLMPGGASLVLLAARWTAQKQSESHSGLRFGWPLTLAVVLASGGFLLATGNRMNLTVYFAALAYVRHRFSRPVSMRLFASGVLAVVFLGLALPTVLRSGDDLANRHLQPVSIEAQYTSFGPVNTFGQAPAFALVLDRGIEHTFGATYAAAVTMFIPRSIAPWKLPDVGQLVTEQLLPELWYKAGTGVQVGAPGEAYVNFGMTGIAIVAVFAGFVMTQLRKLNFRASPMAILFYAVMLPRTALYFRGGFATVTTYLIMDLMIILAAMKFAEVPGRGACPQPRPRSAQKHRTGNL